MTWWIGRFASCCALVGFVASPSGAARAQETRVGDVAAERFQPAPGPSNFVTVETARVPLEFAYSFGLVVDYARQPLRLRHCLPGPCNAAGAMITHLDVVRDLGQATLLAALTPIGRLQIGLRLPFQYIAGDGVVTDSSSAAFGGPVPGGIHGFAMGDPALEAKVRIFGGATSPIALGVALSASAPVGHATANGLYAGYGSPVVDARAILDVDVQRFFAAIDVGAGFKSTAKLGTLDLGSELRFGAGAGVRITKEWQILAEGYGSTNFTASNGSNAAEIDGAMRWLAAKAPVVVTAGGGAGLNEGVGAPAFRVFLGVGVFLDRKENGGAVDIDLDKDGIPNDEDRCPLEGGDVVRIKGPFYGCPKRDSDGDGVPDHLDACPDQPGAVAQDGKTNGCPPNDRDHDGIPNDRDKCPDEAETYNGFQDEDGCPDAPPIRAEVRSDQIVLINERVHFEFGKDRIVGARSFEALDLVAQVIKEHPEIKRLEIAGHTDNVGSDAANLEMSKRRAAAVCAYLMSRGVEASRLTSTGYGPDVPIAKNDTEAGRTANRRVQFNILLLAK
jgi:outer membrane protein OmpA-like peptidoglycan-associated protein